MQLTKQTAQNLLKGLGARAAEKSSPIGTGYVLDERISIERLIGSGGGGEVYKAYQQGIHRDVAVKTLRPGRLNDEEHVARFFREAKLMSGLDHPNIAKVYALGIGSNGQPYFVLDYISGSPLSQLIADGQVNCEEDVVDIFVQVLSGLQHAHERGVIHRDLKPSNILIRRVDNRYAAHIVDFGIACSVKRDNQSLTRTGVVIGSPMYMSPEQCMGKQPDERTDLYSVGCALFETITGRPPFDDQEPASVLRAHVLDDVPSLKKIPTRFKVSPRLRKIIETALRKDRDYRYQTASSMRSDLERLRLGRSIAGSGVVMTPALSRGSKRLCGRLLSVVAGVLVIVFLIAALIHHKKTSEEYQAAVDKAHSMVQTAETAVFFRRWEEGDKLLSAAYDRFINLGYHDKQLGEICHERGLLNNRLGHRDMACLYFSLSLNNYAKYAPSETEAIAEVKYDYTQVLYAMLRYKEALPLMVQLESYYRTKPDGTGLMARARIMNLERLIYTYRLLGYYELSEPLFERLYHADIAAEVSSDRLAEVCRDHATVLQILGKSEEARKQLHMAADFAKKALSE